MRIAEYVQEREGEYYVGATRVTLRSVVTDWKRSRSPEQIVEDFPVVPLVAVYGAITTYLERQSEFDQRFADADATSRREKARTEAAHSAFYDDMRERVARERPRIQAELRQHGILSEDPAASGGLDSGLARDDS